MHTRILKFGSFHGGMLILIILFLFLYNPLAAQRINKKKTSGGTGYLEYLPLDYNTSTSKVYPIIIYLHGAGEAGNGTTELSRAAKWGPLHEVNAGKELCFPVNGQSKCFIVLAPQTSNSELWDIAIINDMVNYALKTYRVNKSMVFLTGFSTGGTGTWRYSYSKYNMPNKLRAVAPVTGKGDTTQLCYLANNNIAVWAFHGAKDILFPKDSTINKVRVLNECIPAPNPKAKLTLVPNGGHNETTWLKVYDVTHTYQNPNLYEWFLSFGKTNQPPVANAGPDQTITLPTNTVTLNGTKSTDDNGITTYKWTKKSGGAATIVSANSATTKVSGLVKGSYVFTLKVTDEKGLTKSDDVGIKVNAATSQLTVAKVGSDQTLVDMGEDGKTVTGIYPNPIDKKLTIKLSKKIQGSAIINFLDESGKLLYRKEVKVLRNQGEINLDLSDTILKQGILFIRVDTENDMGNPVKLVKR